MKYPRIVIVICLTLLSGSAHTAQLVPSKPATTETQTEAPKDTLGRTTPRGTVLGFLNASKKGNDEIAALYLNTPLRGAEAEELARQLALVLDRRLPARLNLLSDKPEGSIPDPLRPDEDLVGTIVTSKGNLDILVERVDRGKVGKVWLFSRQTLSVIPDVYRELRTSSIEQFLPEFLATTRIANVPLYEYLAVFLGLPFLYLLTGLLSRLIGLAVWAFRRRFLRSLEPRNPRGLLPPVRLLLVAFAIRWLLSVIELPLLARQFWSTTALMIAVLGSMWLLMILNSWGEHHLVWRRHNISGSASVLRLVRRLIDGVILFAGLLYCLYHFGVNPTAAFAGIGVGGIAIALAAQKTLENVIAGVSLIADQAVRVGDTLRVGDMLGTVEAVGLRSTRIRTLDRTLVSVPNGQVANMSLETLSVRDKYWFHPVVGLRYETNSVQLRSVVTNMHRLLAEHSSIDPTSVRVRFLRMGAFSLDIDVFAYVYAPDWNDFLAIQEQLLFAIIDIVQQAGAEIAFPSQTMYLAADSSDQEKGAVPHFSVKRGA